MDKYINTDIGIYHVESVCDRKDNDGHKLYHAKCRYCDFENDMRLYDIQHPKECRHKDRIGNIISFVPFWENKQLRHVFYEMKNRCLNPNNKSYRWYGDKGIKICSEWLNNPKSFEEWSLNNGYRSGLTIDRIDSTKDYCPENCQWIPIGENSRKAGNVNWITVNDTTLTGKQWAKVLGIGTNSINRAVKMCGIEKTKELISAMLKEPPSSKNRKPRQNWFSAYGIST